MQDSRIRVLIVEDHLIFRSGLKAILDKENGMEIVASASNGHEALLLFREMRPDVTLMDIRLGPNMSGMETLQVIRQEFSEAKVIMLSVRREPDVIFRSLQSGAAAYLFKETLGDDLVFTIQRVYSGWVMRSPEVEQILRSRDSMQALTTRELEVLGLVGAGLRNKEIAYQLRVERSTVDQHMKNIFVKLAVTDRTKAVMVAIQLGFLEPPLDWQNGKTLK